MKRIVILLACLIFMVGINGKIRVYTRNDQAIMDIYSAYLALALLKEENRYLLFTLLDRPNERLTIKSLLRSDDNLEMINVSKKPLSFTSEDADSLFLRIKKEFFKSDTIVCYGVYGCYDLNPQEDFDYLNCVHTAPFSSYPFQEAVKKSGAKTDDEKIEVLKDWINEVIKQKRMMSTNPRKYLK